MAFDPGSSYNPSRPILLPPVQPGVQPAPVVPTVTNYATGTYQPPQSTQLSNTYEEVSDPGWFVKPEEGDDTWLDDVWDWAKSRQGTSVIGGAISGLGSIYSTELGNEASKERLQMQIDAEERMQKRAIASSEAVLKNARIGRHNASINRPVTLRLKK